jgi:hypothetical protein
MPQERIAHKMEIIQLIPEVTLRLLEFDLLDRGDFDVSVVVGGGDDVDPAEVYEVVGADEVGDGLLHGGKVEVVAGEEVFVGALGAPVPGVEGLWDLAHAEDADVRWQLVVY